jgi:hypothetical protein
MAKGQDADLAERRVRAPVEAADAVEVPEELIRTIEQTIISASSRKSSGSSGAQDLTV